jgi:hypothetical protein
MVDLVFDLLDGHAEPYAAAPTVAFRLRISETSGARIHAIALRCQIRIEPLQRSYNDNEAERLVELFGERPRWVNTLKPMQFAIIQVLVPSFTGSVEVDVPVACTYDFEVSTAKYFHALEADEVPMLMLFSGTVFTEGPSGYAVTQVPWACEARYRLPVAVWRDLMDLYFPNSGWIRLHRDTLDALTRFKAERAIPTWDQALDELLAAREVKP